MNTGAIVLTVALTFVSCFGSSMLLFGDSPRPPTVSASRKTMLTQWWIAASILGTLLGLATGIFNGELLTGLFSFGMVWAGIMVPTAFFVPQMTQRADTRYAHALKICTWLKENFSRVAEEGKELIYWSDLERQLKNSNTTDPERRILCALMADFNTIGNIVQAYPSYTISVDLQVSESPFSAQVYGIVPADLDRYPERLKADPAVGGWLTVPGAKSFAERVKEFALPFREP